MNGAWKKEEGREVKKEGEKGVKDKNGKRLNADMKKDGKSSI